MPKAVPEPSGDVDDALLARNFTEEIRELNEKVAHLERDKQCLLQTCHSLAMQNNTLQIINIPAETRFLAINARVH